MRPMLSTGLAALALVITSTGAIAAPQMLALVASNGPIPVHCTSAECEVELTAFCLEERRDAPHHGTAYRTLRNQDITIVMRHPDGSLSRHPADAGVVLSSARGHSAVRLKLAPTATGGAVPVAVEVARNTAVQPIPRVGDADPHTPEDLKRVAGPLRAIGSRIVDDDAAHTVTARVLNLAINMLPARASDAGPVWRSVRGRVGKAAGSAGVSRAKSIIERCERQPAVAGSDWLSQCLAFHHDHQVLVRNQAYWDAVGAGM